MNIRSSRLFATLVPLLALVFTTSTSAQEQLPWQKRSGQGFNQGMDEPITTLGKFMILQGMEIRDARIMHQTADMVRLREALALKIIHKDATRVATIVAMMP